MFIRNYSGGGGPTSGLVGSSRLGGWVSPPPPKTPLYTHTLVSTLTLSPWSRIGYMTRNTDTERKAAKTDRILLNQEARFLLPLV